MILDFSQLADMIAQRLSGSLSYDEILDTHGAAKLLLISDDTVLRWAARGVIPGKKLDGVWRFRRSALLNHITDNAHPGAESAATASYRAP